MSAETTTADLTHARRAAPLVASAHARNSLIRWRHRRRSDRRPSPDGRAFAVLLVLVFILVAAGAAASYAVGTVAGVW